jgi:hypothetical protein
VFWVNLIASNVGSFLLGFLACRWLARRAAAAAAHLAHTEEPPMPETRRALLPLPARVLILVLVGLLAFGLGVRVGHQVLATKVSEYANDLADSLSPRQEATEDLQAADVRVTRAIKLALIPGHDNRDRLELQNAIAAKARMQQCLDEQRRENPWPDAPREVCE